MTMIAADLVVGKTYRVIYTDGSKTMALTGKYLGGNYADDLLFDLRPKAGTTTIYRERFVDAVIQPGHFRALPHRWT